MNSEYYDGNNYIGPTDCAFCGEPLDDAEEQGPPIADADHALADVRTLDDWQWGAYGRELWSDRYAGDPELEATITLSDEFGSEHEFTALTLPEARAKAAAWVREQKP